MSTMACAIFSFFFFFCVCVCVWFFNGFLVVATLLHILFFKVNHHLLFLVTALTQEFIVNNRFPWEQN